MKKQIRFSPFILLGLAIIITGSGFTPTNDCMCLQKTYNGTHGDKKITLVINNAKFKNGLSFKGTLSGYNTVGKTTRPVKGTFQLHTKGVYSVDITEPGDNKYDGRFQLTFQCYSNGKTDVYGRWDCFSCGISRDVEMSNK